MEQKRYQLRCAAGSYWLLDMEQDGKNFRKPLRMNETGAMIWKSLEEGMQANECADKLICEYGVTREQALADIESFLEALKSQGMAISRR